MLGIAGDISLVSLMVVKPLIILTLVLVGWRYLKVFSASVQHFCLSLGLLSLLLLPLAVWLLPVIEVAVLPAVTAPTMLQPSLAASPANAAAPWPWWEIVIGAYMLGVFWVVFYLLTGLIHVWRQTRASRGCDNVDCGDLLSELVAALGIRRKVTIVVCSPLQAPQVWGLFRPTIMVPAGFTLWPLERKRRVLIHELAHIRRCDWLVLLLSRLVCALFWFLPLTWILAKKVQVVAELACDDLVVELEGQGIAYAEDLLTIVKQRGEPRVLTTYTHNSDSVLPNSTLHNDVVLSVINGSPIYLRIRALLDSARDRSRVSLARKLMVLMLGLLLVLPLSSLQATVIKDTVVGLQRTVKRWIPINTVSLPEKTEKRSWDKSALEAVESLPSLSQLQSRLSIDKLKIPQPPTSLRGEHALEEVLVYARESVDEELWLDQVDENQVGKPYVALQPHIQIQGYMPQKTVTPVYPRRAVSGNIEGMVIVQFTIAPTGRVEQPRIVVSQPKRIFDKVVLKALEQFRFKPQRVNGQAIALTGVTETFLFRLTEEEKPRKKRRRTLLNNTAIARYN